MAPYTELKVQGYEEFTKVVKEHEDKNVFVYFTGNKNEQGVSWCPDCVKAEPVVRSQMEYLPEDSIFIFCQVGERPYWKDSGNAFKKILKLRGVPTLLRYGTAQKLEEEECFDANLVQMMFTEE
ncbi:thioredoxin domain-containing protein 17 [Erpetoichthys calabaricus]|uniref:Thioredoxin domain-containing protein 17 n=1 Tax=Erpetoichthys calabaricus TaxID=27687 RepID=A0A8C4S798_ERPCA|nr:thioredoxin domain-containing protein 17 [Erpetoichthys calabaricus]